ncbi:rod shape-determining protein MreD [Lutimaribacter marinistellae]|uniref:Rod shape-determining protein MreD n=1 Tax=Lutimaribacter marinistellae TaxID=1820329 RepID=A0ABV7TAZ9_9RHOB
MANPSPSRLWVMRAAYLGLSLLILFFHLLPLDTVPRHWAPPDLLIALTFAWAMRRPDFVPSAAIALVMLTADLLLHRPPGLLAALVVGGAAWLKADRAGLSEASFLGEWVSVGLVLIVIAIANRLLLGLTAVEQAPFWLTVIQLVLTIAVYPLVVLVSQLLFGVRRLAPSEAEAMGARS